MTEEEEKAINSFKSYINAIDTFGTIDKKCCNNLYEPAQVVLDLLEKLKKENIKLKQEQAKRNWIHVKENGEVVPMFYISKDKIRKNLKHCEEELEKINNGEEFEDERDFYDYAILIYKDLLEEENDNG